MCLLRDASSPGIGLESPMDKWISLLLLLSAWLQDPCVLVLRISVEGSLYLVVSAI